MDKRKVVAFSFKIALVILIISVIMLFMVPPKSAEFIILLVTIGICTLVAVLALLRIRKD